MAIRDIFKVSRKTFVDPAAWVNLEALIDFNKSLWAIVRGLFQIQKLENPETFDEAVKRQHLTHQDIENTKNRYFLYAIFFLVCALASVGYGCYLVFTHYLFLGFLLALATSALFLVQAFKYHFWYFQIKHKKLGCTFNEWLNGKVVGPKGK